MRTGGDVIVLWAAEASPDTCVWASHAPPGVRVMLAAPDALGRAVPAALARGPVIAIVGNDRDAHRALALGVDEVLRAHAASHEALLGAAESARLRAIGRDARPRSSSPVDEDAKAIELLAASVGYRLANPLAVASLNVEVLRGAMSAMTGLADAYVRDTAARAQQPPVRGSDELRAVALRASAPPSAELHATMDELARALQEASTAVSQVYALVAPDEFDDACDLCSVVSEVAKLVAVVVERVAELRVDLPSEPCRAAMPRSQIVQALTALLSNSLQAVRDPARHGRRGTVTLRLWAREDVALLEVIDNGIGMSPSVRARALDPFFTTREGSTGLGLSMVAERVRRAGGEIVLESEHGLGTTVRLFVPLAPPGAVDAVSTRSN
jgi:signal transduction histidine kinase